MTLTIKLIRLGCPVALPFHFFSLTRGLSPKEAGVCCMLRGNETDKVVILFG